MAETPEKNDMAESNPKKDVPGARGAIAPPDKTGELDSTREGVTTPENVARIIDDENLQPKIYPDALTKPVTDEVAGAISDPFWSYYVGKILLNPDKTLRTESGGRAVEIFEELERDPQVRSNLQTRRLAVVGKEWEVVPASDKRQDLKISDFVQEVLLKFDFDTARYNLLQAINLGYKVSEIMWEYSEGDVWIKEMIARPSRRFTFGLLRELRLITRHNMVEGDPVPERKFQLIRFGGDNGSPYGDGIGTSLYWPVWFKKNAIKFWLIFSEKFGSPTTIGTYPPGTTKEQQDALLGALAAIQQESAIKIPETMKISFLEAQRTGSLDNYHELCSFMNAEITKVIMGQTLTTEMGGTGGKGGGSFAASKTHNDVRGDYTKADADVLSIQLNNQLVRWIVDYNFPGVKAYPKVWIRTEDEQDLKPLAERDQILLNMGAKIPESYIHDTYGIPVADPDEPVLVPVKGAGQAASDSSGDNSAGGGFSENLTGRRYRGLGQAVGDGGGDNDLGGGFSE
jgi:phage gp29-like protein